MLPPTPPTVGAKIFAYTPLKTVYVKDEKTKTRYEVAAPWNEYEIVVLNATGIENTEIGNNAAITADCYDLNGRRITGRQSGPAIMRYADGSTRKVVVR